MIISSPRTADESPAGSGGREPSSASRWRLVWLAAGLLAIGFNLRIGVASVGPLLDDIRADLHLTSTAASLLTTLPVLGFGVFAFVAPILTRRLGLHRLMGLAMLVLAAGIALRYQPSLLALYAGTLIVGAAIAVGNVTMPAAIKQDFTKYAGLMTGLYTMTLGIGAALSSGLSVPLYQATDGDWRLALAVWAVPALIAAVLWIPQFRRRPVRAQGSEVGEPLFRRLLTDRVALAVTCFMGLQSLAYYTTLTWVPTIFRDAGLSASQAGWMLSFSSFPGMLASLTTPMLARRIRVHWIPVALCAACFAGAYAGLLFAPTAAPYLWMVCLGLGQGSAISLGLTYIVLRSPDTHHTGHLSTMAQGVGYLIAALGPIGIGALHSATHSWTVPLLTLAVLLIGQLLAGIAASRERHVLAPR